MKYLEQYGVFSADAGVLLHNDHNEINSSDFFEQSSLLLPKLAEVVGSDIVPNLQEYYGRWHPTGFMVYPLGTHAALGSLRLHVWTKGLRQRDANWNKTKLDDIYDGDIHNHGWNISSLVTAGMYSDNFYTLSSAEKGTEVDVFKVFEVDYGGDNPEALVTDGTQVAVSLDSSRKVFAGELHEIEAGPFHAPTVPDNTLGATLVFSSKRIIPTGPQILIANAEGPIVGNRQDITPEEKNLAKEQLQ